MNLGDEGELSTVNWFLSSSLLLLVDAEGYGINDCWLMEGLSGWQMGWSLAVSRIYSCMLALQNQGC